MGVADTKAEQEPVWVGLGEGVMSFSCLVRWMHPDTRDTRSDDDALRRFEKLSGKLKDSRAIRKPQSSITELLKLGGCPSRCPAIPPEERAPDADSTKLHGGSSFIVDLEFRESFPCGDLTYSVDYKSVRYSETSQRQRIPRTCR
jgi:hypothetical protein